MQKLGQNMHKPKQGKLKHSMKKKSAGTDLIREFDADLHIIVDPGCRITIDRFHPNIRDEVKRAYLLKGPTQPRGHAFPKKKKCRCLRGTGFCVYDGVVYFVSKGGSYCFFFFFVIGSFPKIFASGHDNAKWDVHVTARYWTYLIRDICMVGAC